MDYSFALTTSHLTSSSFKVKKDQEIKKGAIIGKTAKTGNIATLDKIEDRPHQQHCHLEVYIGEGSWGDKNKRVNPKNYIHSSLKTIIESYEK